MEGLVLFEKFNSNDDFATLTEFVGTTYGFNFNSRFIYCWGVAQSEIADNFVASTLSKKKRHQSLQYQETSWLEKFVVFHSVCSFIQPLHLAVPSLGRTFSVILYSVLTYLTACFTQSTMGKGHNQGFDSNTKNNFGKILEVATKLGTKFSTAKFC